MVLSAQDKEHTRIGEYINHTVMANRSHIAECRDGPVCVWDWVFRKDAGGGVCLYLMFVHQRRFTFRFTFSHLADAFVQSDVQGREQSS